MVDLYEQIKDAEKELELTPSKDGDEDGENDVGSVRNDEPVRRQKTGPKHGQGPGEGDGEGEEAGGRRGSSGDAPSGESGASSGDAGTRKRSGGKPRSGVKDAQEAGGTSREDGEASREDGEDVDGSVRGQGGQHELDEEKLEKPLTNADWARQRRENRELRAKLAKLEAERSAAPTKPVEAKTEETKPATEAKKDAPKEPDKNVNYQEWLEWKLAQTDNTVQEQAKLLQEQKEWKIAQEKTFKEQEDIRRDVDAFTTIEKRYIEKNPDYENATAFAREKYFNAIKMAMPQATDAQIDMAIDNEILGYARKWASEGLDPAEEFYSMAQERFGYEPNSAKPQVEEEDAEQSPLARKAAEKPNLKTISANKKRSASPLTGGGQGGRLPLTLENAVNDMSIGEFSKLTPDELSALETMG